jgi:hypothetical protein
MKQQELKNSFALSVFAFISLFIISPVFAESLCDIALNSKAFNTSDYDTSTKILMSKKDDACNAVYTSEGEAISSAKSSGANVGYGGFSVGYSEAKQVGENKWSIKDSKFCHASAEELDSATSTRAKTQVASDALKAWSECIDKTASNNLFVEYTLNPGGTGFTGLLRFRVSSGKTTFKITGIESNLDPSNNLAKVNCSIGRKNIQTNSDKDVDIIIDKTKTSIKCTKNANTSLKISLNTDQDDQTWIDLPSATELKQTKIEDLNDELNKLKSDFNDVLDKNNKSFQTVNTSVSAILTSINDVKTNKVDVSEFTNICVISKGPLPPGGNCPKGFNPVGNFYACSTDTGVGQNVGGNPPCATGAYVAKHMLLCCRP